MSYTFLSCKDLVLLGAFFSALCCDFSTHQHLCFIENKFTSTILFSLCETVAPALREENNKWIQTFTTKLDFDILIALTFDLSSHLCEIQLANIHYARIAPRQNVFFWNFVSFNFCYPVWLLKNKYKLIVLTYCVLSTHFKHKMTRKHLIYCQHIAPWSTHTATAKFTKYKSTYFIHIFVWAKYNEWRSHF